MQISNTFTPLILYYTGTDNVLTLTQCVWLLYLIIYTTVVSSNNNYFSLLGHTDISSQP